MSNQKNIDRLFQEKLQNFEQKPRPEVWSQIQGRMAQKKKRRLPFWLLYGAAAILLIGLFVFFPKDPSNKEIIIDPSITVSPNDDTLTDTIKKIEPKKPFQKKDPVLDNKTLLTEKTQKEKVQPINRKNAPNKNIGSETIIAEVVKKGDESLNKENGEKTIENQDHRKQERKDPLDKIKGKKEEKRNDKRKKKLDSKPVIDISKKADSSKTKSINTKKKDFFASLEEETLEKKEKDKKWSVRPLVAFSSAAGSSSSPTDQAFGNNATSGNATFNYGLSVSYQINEKFTIQTGIMTQNMSFNTEDIRLVIGTNALNTFSSIELDNNLPFFLFSASSSPVSSDNLVLGQNANLVDANAELNQVIGYVEIPIEVKYKVFNSKKVSSSVIGGFSSLFLNNNEIVLFSNVSGEASIGEASNLNSVNFSGNFGLDFDYAISKNLFLNINPMVKVQMNTFSKDNNGYVPVFIGVYSGIKYQF